jgi:hypothetical protein
VFREPSLISRSAALPRLRARSRAVPLKARGLDRRLPAQVSAPVPCTRTLPPKAGAVRRYSAQIHCRDRNCSQRKGGRATISRRAGAIFLHTMCSPVTSNKASEQRLRRKWDQQIEAAFLHRWVVSSSISQAGNRRTGISLDDIAVRRGTPLGLRCIPDDAAGAGGGVDCQLGARAKDAPTRPRGPSSQIRWLTARSHRLCCRRSCDPNNPFSEI